MGQRELDSNHEAIKTSEEHRKALSVPTFHQYAYLGSGSIYSVHHLDDHEIQNSDLPVGLAGAVGR